MEISKKDLLKETGISYGQLYRWKREGLIPEGWFVKRPSPTGQETYFPKGKILQRIHSIQQLKDTCSLEEMAKMLTPEVSNRLFSEEDLEEFSEINIEVAAIFMDLMEKDSFTYYEILVMMVLSGWKNSVTFDEETLHQLIASAVKALPRIASEEWRLALLRVQEDCYLMALEEHSPQTTDREPFYLDERIAVVQSISIQDYSSQMKVKYKETFAFTFDEEVS